MNLSEELEKLTPEQLKNRIKKAVNRIELARTNGVSPETEWTLEYILRALLGKQN